MSEQNKPLLSEEIVNDVVATSATKEEVGRRLSSWFQSKHDLDQHKDRELIQTLVGELIQSRASILGWIPDELTPMAHQMKIALKRINSALTLAGEQGHKPTEK